MITPETESETELEGYYKNNLASETLLYDRSYRWTSDVQSVWGAGVWPYRPFHSVQLREHNEEFDYGPVVICENADDGSNHTGSYAPSFVFGGEHPIPWNDLYSRLGGRVESRLPSLRPDIDLAVFLFELRDIASILDVLALKGKSLIDKLANTDLGYHFAIAPVFGEASAIATLLKSFSSRLAALRVGEGKVHDFKTSVNWSSEICCEPIGAPYGWRPATCPQVCPNGLTAGQGYEWVEQDVYASATVKYRYTLPSINHLLDSVGLMMTQAGLFPTWESMWEIVPFSFVVDWVFDTKRLVEAVGLDETGMDVKTEIIDICVTSRCVEQLGYSYNRMCHSPFSGSSPQAHRRETRCARVTGSDAWTALQGPLFRLPGFMQLHLGASLLAKLVR